MRDEGAVPIVSETGSYDPGPMPLWTRVLAFVSIVVAVIAVATIGFMSYMYRSLSPPQDESDPGSGPVVFSGTLDDVPVPEARARSLGMLMEIYDALSREAGVGDWQPDLDYRRQVWESELVCSTDGQESAAEEVYDLAHAAPYPDEEKALAVVGRIAASYGFEPGTGSVHIYADFVRASDQATISLYNRSGDTEETHLFVSSGCHRGSYLQDWPAGTEVVPGYLRGWGPDESPQAWADQTPAVPTPSRGWPTPTYTPVPTGPRPSPATRQS